MDNPVINCDLIFNQLTALVWRLYHPLLMLKGAGYLQIKLYAEAGRINHNPDSE